MRSWRKRLSYTFVVMMAVAVASFAHAHAQSGATMKPAARETGYAVKKPVFGGACRICPWGAIGEVVKEAMKGSGWDIQQCYSCAGGPEEARGVADARIPKPLPSPNALTPAPPNGPEDFGATGPQYLYWAYKGTHEFAKDPQGPRSSLRVIANIMEPRFYVVGVKADSGITDLHQIAEKKMPVQIFASGAGIDLTSPAVLAYYGLTKEAVESWGGKIVGNVNAATGSGPDVFLAWGSLDNTPEYNSWYAASQKYDLKYLTLPDDLRAQLVKDEDLLDGHLPIGIFKGVDHEVPVVARTGTTVYGRTDMPDDFAYALAKALDEHQDLLQWANAGIAFSYNRHTVWKVFDMPLHPGAARYYKQMGYMK